MSTEVHPRTKVVASARSVIAETVSQTTGSHDLTYAELALVLADVLHTWAAEAVRVEREKPQPDPTARDDWRPGP